MSADLVASLSQGADLDGFRRALRYGVAAGVSPEHVTWQIGGDASLFSQVARAPVPAPPVSLPGKAAELVELVVCHKDSERYALLYKLVWRILQGERALLEIHSDPLVYRLTRMAKSIRREIHKMHAFLRFRRIESDSGEHFVAWFESEHHILEKAADFFVQRFPSMRWSILTPHGSLHWDCAHLTVGPPGNSCDAPTPGELEGAWDAYFQSTFNPSRLNIAQMHKEMPRKYWHNLPETKLIPDMLRTARDRVENMMTAQPQPAMKRSPEKALTQMLSTDIMSLDALNAIIARSEPFVRGGKRAVLGEGPLSPSIAFVGEQPGDQEDLQGRPFVGPAGRLFDRALEESGVTRAQCYVTNAVKHFKFEERGKRRIHQKPTMGEVKHYRWWLMKELEFVRPKLVVALGGTAALALTGKPVAITRSRGPLNFSAQKGYVTVHPSHLLRISDEEGRTQAYASFVTDLVEARVLSERSGTG